MILLLSCSMTMCHTKKQNFSIAALLNNIFREKTISPGLWLLCAFVYMYAWPRVRNQNNFLLHCISLPLRGNACATLKCNHWLITVLNWSWGCLQSEKGLKLSRRHCHPFKEMHFIGTWCLQSCCIASLNASSPIQYNWKNVFFN